MSILKRHRTNLPIWLVTVALFASLLPWTGGARAEPPEPTPTHAPFAYGVSFLAPSGQAGTTYQGAPDSASALPTAEPAELAAEALDRVNDARQAASLSPLLLSEALTAAASEHATDLQSSGAFLHRGSDGSWPADRADRHGHPAIHLGENMAVGYVTAQATVDAWLTDDGSRANLLDPRFTRAGLAFAQDGPWHNYWVLMLADSPAYRPGHVLVRFQPAVAATSIQTALAQVNATSLGTVGSLKVERLAVPVGQETAVVAALQQNPAVAFAELDYRVRAVLEPDDPGFQDSIQWGLHNTGQSGGTNDADIDAPEAWDLTTGDSSVIVAIVDTGVDQDHVEFSGRLVTGRHFFNNGQEDENTDDGHGHGTHVAGIVAATGNNGDGVAGVAWGVRIMPVKVLENDGSGWTSDVVSGISYAADNGAKVINLSLGSTRDSSTLQSAVNYAHDQGALVVAAAGNCGDSSYLYSGCDYQDQSLYPAAGNNALAVASTTRWDIQSGFSNQGSYVDVAAPGSFIYSTMPGSYGYKSGTSMATPFVSGLASLLLSTNSNLTPDEVETIIEQTADDLGEPGRDDVYGWGRINAYQALLLSSFHALEGTVYDQGGHGVAGVLLTISGGQVFTATTEGDGSFSRANLPQDTYVVTPTLANLTFSPPTRTIAISESDVTDITFTALDSETFAISGTVRTAEGDGLPDVQVVVASDHVRLSTQTDTQGRYTHTGLISDTYVVTPMAHGATFEPPSRTVIINGADQTGVDFVRSDFVVYLPAVLRNFAVTVFPNDPYFENGTQWGLHNTGQSGGTNDADIDAPEAWGLSTGDNSVIVAIVDTGIDQDHVEFSGRLVTGRHFFNNGQEDGNTDDDHGHGTHAAGIAAAAGNNGIGVAGVAWGVRIMPVKALDSDGNGWTSDIASGVTYATDHDAKVINLSLGGTRDSSTLQDAVDYAHDQGALVVAAAGNCGDSSYPSNGCDYQDQPSYPAAGSSTLAVASTTRYDTQSSFSNEGDYVDIAAPGSFIYSTVPGGYSDKSGTSMATPFVAGLAGLIYSTYPSYTPYQVAQAIVHNADDLGAPGHDDMYGCGRINAHRSLLNGAVSDGCVGWSGFSLESSQAYTTPPADAEFRPGALLVKFQDVASLVERDKVLADHALAESLNADPAVAYAEPDYKLYALPLWPRSPTTKPEKSGIQ
jgi:thermitase